MDCEDATLTDATLINANLGGSCFRRAKLLRANLSRADLYRVDLTGADLRGARLVGASLVETILVEADLTGCSIYGAAVWKLVLGKTKQSNLIISPPDEPTITVDNIEVAQFIYLLLNNQKNRHVIDTITSKVGPYPWTVHPGTQGHSRRHPRRTPKPGLPARSFRFRQTRKPGHHRNSLDAGAHGEVRDR